MDARCAEEAKITFEELKKKVEAKKLLFKLAESGDDINLEILLTQIEPKPDVKSRNRNGETPLHLAAKHRYSTPTIQLLLDAKADVNAKDYLKLETPLIIAADQGHSDTGRSLIKAKADVNAKDMQCRPVVSLAASRGYDEFLRILIEAKADLEMKDSLLNSPLQYSANTVCRDLIQSELSKKAEALKKEAALEKALALEKVTPSDKSKVIKEKGLFDNLFKSKKNQPIPAHRSDEHVKLLTLNP